MLFRFWVDFRCPSADPTLTPRSVFRDVSLCPISPCPQFQPHVGAAERNAAPVTLHPHPHAAVPGAEGTPRRRGVPEVKPSPQWLPLWCGMLSALRQLLGESLLPAHTCACTHTRAHACAHAHIHVCTCTHTHAHKYACTHAHLLVHTHTGTRAHTHAAPPGCSGVQRGHGAAGVGSPSSPAQAGDVQIQGAVSRRRPACFTNRNDCTRQHFRLMRDWGKGRLMCLKLLMQEKCPALRLMLMEMEKGRNK